MFCSTAYRGSTTRSDNEVGFGLWEGIYGQCSNIYSWIDELNYTAENQNQ